MRTIIDMLESVADILVWVVVAWVLFGFATMAQGQELSRQQKVVAQTLLGEARGEGYAGMYAVACLINQRSVNRKLEPWQVCLQDWQFSCWNKNDKNRHKLPSLLNADTQQAKWAKSLAVHLMRLNTDYIKGADHYCTLSSNPYWYFKKVIVKGEEKEVPIKPVGFLGNHKFYKLK